MSQHTRPSWRVRRSWPEIIELMNVGLPNQIAGANRRPPWASATALGSRSSTWLAHVGSQAAVAQLHRSAGRAGGFDALRLGVFALLRFDGAGFNAEKQRRKDAVRKWPGGGCLASLPALGGREPEREIFD